MDQNIFTLQYLVIFIACRAGSARNILFIRSALMIT